MIELLNQRFPSIEGWFPVLLPLFLVAYFSPFIVAIVRKHRFGIVIGLLNLFLGFTLLGWLASMIWAVNKDVRERGDETASSDPVFYLDEPRLNEPRLNEHPEQAQDQGVAHASARQCPFCAESIKTEAVVCRFCRRDLAALPVNAQQSGAVNAALMEKHFEELQTLLKDREDAAAEKFAEVPVQPATNYEPAQKEAWSEKETVSADVVRELSGWKKFG